MNLEDRFEHINSELKKHKKVDTKQIKEIVRKLFFKQKNLINDNDLLYEIICITKSDMNEAHRIFEGMQDLGLGLCKNFISYNDIEKFALLRGFLSKEEIRKENKRVEAELEKEEKEKELWEKKFFEKHGDEQSKWSPETIREHDDFYEY